MTKKTRKKTETKQLIKSKKSKKSRKMILENLVKKAVEDNQWILLIGGSDEERGEIYKMVKSANNPNTYFSKAHKIDILGCTGLEIYDQVKKGLNSFFKSLPTVDSRIKQITNQLPTAHPIFFVDNLCCVSNDDINALKKLSSQLRAVKSKFPHSPFWMLIVGVEKKEYLKKIPDQFINLFGKQIHLSGHVKKVRKNKNIFNDVKLEIEVDDTDHPLFDAYASAKNVKKQKLKFDPRFVAPLHLLAKTVKDDKNDGWVYNIDLKKTCNDGANTAKCEITKAFDIIGQRAKGLISIKHGVAKRLNIPKKNIIFTRYKS